MFFFFFFCLRLSLSTHVLTFVSPCNTDIFLSAQETEFILVTKISGFTYFSQLTLKCDGLWDFGPYGGTWANFGFLHNLTCSYVLSILDKF